MKENCNNLKLWNLKCPDKWDMEDSEYIEKNPDLFSYWRSLLYAMHVIGAASKYDAASGETLHQSFVDILTLLHESFINETDFIPEDNIYRTCEQCYSALEFIFNNPRSRLQREHPVLPVRKAKEMDIKCMRWLARQPGKTVREKLGVKQRVKCLKRFNSLDILENQLVVRFVKEFSHILANRLRWLTFAKKTDTPLGTTLRLMKTLPDTRLSEIQRCVEIKPNNVLLSDKNYNRIWRAVHWFKDYDSEIKNIWRNGEFRFSSLIFWTLAARIFANDNVYAFDQFCKFEPGFKTKNNGIVYLNKETESWFNIDDESYMQKVILYSRNDEHLYSYECAFYAGKIMIVIYNYEFRNDIFSKTSDGVIYSLDFDFYYDNNLRECENSVIVGINDSRQKETFKLNKKGVGALIDLITVDMKKKGFLSGKLKKKSILKKEYISRLGCDFSTNIPILTAENKALNTNLLLYKTKDKIQDAYDSFIGSRDRFIHFCNKGSSTGFDDFWNESEDDEIADVITSTINEITDEHDINQLTDLAIAFPDCMEELAQVELRKAIPARFNTLSLPWRSVCAMMSWQNMSDFAKTNIKERDAVIIIDTDAPQLTISCLIAHKDDKVLKYNKNTKGFFWERCNLMQKFDSLDNLSFQSFMKDYLKEYISKYFNSKSFNEHFYPSIEQHLIKSGQLENIILNKMVFHIPIDLDSKEFLRFQYDEKIIDKISKKWIAGVKKNIGHIKKINFKNVETQNRVSGLYIAIFGKLLGVSSVEKQLKSAVDYMPGDARTVSRGADVYLDRWRRGLPTYKDWVPSLYLKTRHSEIKIPGGLVAPGDKISTIIPQVLQLPAGVESYAFPLSREKKSKKNIAFEAVLNSHHFPLPETIDIKIKVKYIYGTGAFRLVLLPINKKLAPFKQLEVLWKRGNEGEKQLAAQVINERPKMPQKRDPNPTIANVVSIIKDFEHYFNNEEFLSHVYDVAEVKEGMIFKGKIKGKGKTGALFINNGYGVDSYLPNPASDYKIGDYIYNKILSVDKQDVSEIDSKEELSKNQLYIGNVKKRTGRGINVALGSGIQGFAFDDEGRWNVGDSVCLKFHKIRDRGSIIFKIASNFNIKLKEINIQNLKSKELERQHKQGASFEKELKNKSWRELEITMKMLLLSNLDNLTENNIRNIQNIILPFFNNNKQSRAFDLLTCLGDYCPEELIDDVIARIKRDSKQPYYYHLIGRLLGDNIQNKAVDFIIKDIAENEGNIFHINRPLGALANGIWIHNNLLYDINTKMPAFIKTVLLIIEKRYDNLKQQVVKNEKNAFSKADEVIKYLSPFQYNNELLFGLLMLRGEDNDLFKAGTERMLNIAETIVEIDKIFMKHRHECQSRFKFNMSDEDEKERDRDMSQFVYIIDNYLRGEDISRRITIKDISVDE